MSVIRGQDACRSEHSDPGSPTRSRESASREEATTLSLHTHDADWDRRKVRRSSRTRCRPTPRTPRGPSLQWSLDPRRQDTVPGPRPPCPPSTTFLAEHAQNPRRVLGHALQRADGSRYRRHCRTTPDSLVGPNRDLFLRPAKRSSDGKLAHTHCQPARSEHCGHACLSTPSRRNSAQSLCPVSRAA